MPSKRDATVPLCANRVTSLPLPPRGLWPGGLRNAQWYPHLIVMRIWPEKKGDLSSENPVGREWASQKERAAAPLTCLLLSYHLF